MVTPNDVETSSEDTASPEATESLPVSGDEPLIPSNFVEGVGVPDEAAATVTEATTGDDTSSDEIPTDDAQETTESTEETPEAESAVIPQEDATDTESESDESETPRSYSTEEWGKRETTYRQRDTENTTRITELETQMTRMGDQFQNQLVDAQANGYIEALTQRYQDDGMDQRQAVDRATTEVNTAKADYFTKQENSRLKQEIVQANQTSENTARSASVDNLMGKYGVPESQRDLLNGYTDARLADRTAQALGEAETQRKSNIAAKLKEVPAGGAANNYDAASGAVGGQSEADWVENVWNQGKASGPEALARALKYKASRSS